MHQIVHELHATQKAIKSIEYFQMVKGSTIKIYIFIMQFDKLLITYREYFMLIIILVVALLIGYLAMTQMGSLGFGKPSMQQEQTQQNVIEQAQNAVDAINNHLRQTDLEP